MTTRLLTIGTAVASVVAAFGIFAPSAQATYYYDESYYNRPIPCYQYDGAGHCTRSGARYNARAPMNNSYYNGSNQNAYYYNGSMYSNQYLYGQVNYGTNGRYRPITNYYRGTQNSGCYWYYGSYRCDDRY